MVSQIAFSSAIASASVIAGASAFAGVLLAFDVTSRFVGGWAHATAITNAAIKTKSFFIVELLAFIYRAECFLFQSTALVKDSRRPIRNPGETLFCFMRSRLPAKQIFCDPRSMRIALIWIWPYTVK